MLYDTSNKTMEEKRREENKTQQKVGLHKQQGQRNTFIFFEYIRSNANFFSLVKSKMFLETAVLSLSLTHTPSLLSTHTTMLLVVEGSFAGVYDRVRLTARDCCGGDGDIEVAGTDIFMGDE